MSKFNVGDKIVFYETGSRIEGEIFGFEGGRILATSFCDIRYSLHPKQCRKLVKKKRHEFWLDFGAITGLHINMNNRGNIPISSDPVEGWTKVRECK